MGITSSSTATASSSQVDEDGNYLHEGLIIADSAGASHYEVRVTDPSSGTISLKAWSGGAKTTPAE